MTTKMTGTRTINPTNVLLFLPLYGQMQLLLAFLLLLLLLRYRSYLVCDERVRYITVMTITLAVLLHLGLMVSFFVFCVFVLRLPF